MGGRGAGGPLGDRVTTNIREGPWSERLQTGECFCLVRSLCEHLSFVLR